MAGEHAIFEPITIRYNGLDAAHHQMELLALGRSFQGAARMLGVAGNFAYTGDFVRKQPALAVRVLTQPPREACYEIVAIIASVLPALPLSPLELTKIVEQLVKYMLAKFSKQPGEAAMALEVAMKALTEMGQTSRAGAEAIKAQAEATKAQADAMKVQAEASKVHGEAMLKAIEAMAESQRPNVRLLVAPIGETCDTMFVGNPDRQPLILDRAAKAAIEEAIPPEVLREKNYDVQITEIDVRRHTCKLSLPSDDEPDRRYDGEISDPVIEQPNDPYSMAVTRKATVRVRAKVELKEGDFHKFYISDIGNAA